MTSCFFRSFLKIPRVYDPKKVFRMRNLSHIPRVLLSSEDPNKSLVSDDNPTNDKLAEDLEDPLASDNDLVREKLAGYPGSLLDEDIETLYWHPATI
jgi:hypothetical protein